MGNIILIADNGFVAWCHARGDPSRDLWIQIMIKRIIFLALHVALSDKEHDADRAPYF